MKLHQRRWGSGDLRILLVHGLLSSGEGWWRLGPDLAALGFEVSAPDLRGHGVTGPGDGYAVSSYRDDVLGMGGGWDVVIGHSLGGRITLECQYAEPEFADALILVDPALRVMESGGLLGQLLAEFDLNTEDLLAAARPRWAQGDVQAKIRALTAVDPGVVEETLRALTATQVWAHLAEVSIPTLIVGADPMGGDSLVTELDGRRAERNPAVQYLAIEGASHSPHRDSYEAFYDIVRQYLDDLDLLPGLG